ncbi:PREDICTED: uncharacterized protein LOC104816774 [Tarenaya hassleriana]|uniref:uncharacterized protein LOC104816774 n=1 Tax=Tarenaya hassleriana TaxID=28532 RepID=UPI00053C45EE|nr:PREDICTED: uncharacterized protein LOC104816774 [Tarenaya hassleriana]
MEEERETSSLLREQRNLREKDRRMRMKHLFSHLSSLVSNKRLPVPQLIDEATIRMKQLKERVRELKQKKERLLGGRVEEENRLRFSPSLHVSARESTVELNLIIGPDAMNFALLRIMTALEEEGAEIMSVNLHNMEHKTICTIIVKAIISRIGIDASRIEKTVRDIIL